MEQAESTKEYDMTTSSESAQQWDKLGGPLVPLGNDPRLPFFFPPPTLRILFYTDSEEVEDSFAPEFGVGRLIHMLHGNQPEFASFQPHVLNRHEGGHAANRLTAALLSGYDQIWFFGILQSNLAGQPQNELSDAEVTALRTWMDKGGGVLITGDHSNLRPSQADPALDEWLNLGRALGRRVPRASELRRWEGLPNAIPATSHNTNVQVGVLPIDHIDLQKDGKPQRLTLTKYDAGWTFPLGHHVYRPHPLFCGITGPIEVFPDHMHEGQLELPHTYPEATWPSGPGGQPRPEIIARGTDKRTGEIYGVVSAFNGHEAGVGRIVADSTWHHYFNINLVGFPPSSTTFAAMADYYANLSIWLATPSQQRQMRLSLLWNLATNNSVGMVAYHPYRILGAAGLDVLNRRASQCLVSELIFPGPVYAEERRKFPWPPDVLVLGGILAQYQQAFDLAVEGSKELPEPDVLVSRGISAAQHEHVRELRQASQAAEDLTEIIEDKFGEKSGNPRGKMSLD